MVNNLAHTFILLFFAEIGKEFFLLMCLIHISYIDINVLTDLAHVVLPLKKIQFNDRYLRSFNK